MCTPTLLLQVQLHMQVQTHLLFVVNRVCVKLSGLMQGQPNFSNLVWVRNMTFRKPECKGHTVYQCIFKQSTNDIYIYVDNLVSTKLKFCTQETLNLLIFADSSIITNTSKTVKQHKKFHVSSVMRHVSVNCHYSQ